MATRRVSLSRPDHMFREFFLGQSVKGRVVAWGGLVVIVAHGVLRAYIKYALNSWYGEFYDAGGGAAEVSSGDADELRAGKEEMYALLLRFSYLCIPNVFLHPIYKLIINVWVLRWRVCLIESYLDNWKTREEKIENGAQRVHEDTQRFARGLQTCCVTVLDSILTLSVFSPLLVELGVEVQPVDLPDYWLFLLCALVALVGVFGSLFFGWSLVDLEVRNQVVEAELRKKLVLLEESPRSLVPSSGTRAREFTDENSVHVDASMFDGASEVTSPKPQPPRSYFYRVIDSLRENYMNLYRAFSVFSLWLSSYEQAIVLLPYMITAPMLFSMDYDRRISLGKVTQLSNAFANVFSALNVLTDNWIELTDWLSVLRRLREWEAHISTPSFSSTRSLVQLSDIPSCQFPDECHEGC